MFFMTKKEYKKLYYENNKDNIKAKNLKYYYDNIQKCKENQKKYRNEKNNYYNNLYNNLFLNKIKEIEQKLNIEYAK